MRDARQILFLTTSLDTGGAEAQLVRLVLGLHRRGWTVRVVTLLSPAGPPVELETAGIPLTSLGMRARIPALLGCFRLIRLLRKHRPAILVTFMFHANVLGRVAGRLAGVPAIVSSLRNTRFGAAWRDWFERITIPLDSVTTTNSRIGADMLRRRGILRNGRVRVVPNGLALDRFRFNSETRAVVRKAEGVGDREFLWIAVGHLFPQKDYQSLLAAFAEVSRRAGDARLWIIGEGPERPILERGITEDGLGHAVRLLGLRHDVPQLLNAADAVVLSSAWEGSPNIVIEALAMGRPVVATAVGGAPELVRDGESGVLVAPHDSSALARGMLHVMDLDSSERQRMGDAARRDAEMKFDIERVIAEWESLLADLLPDTPVADRRPLSP